MILSDESVAAICRDKTYRK